MEKIEVNNKWVVAYQGDLLKLSSNVTGDIYFDTTDGTMYEILDTEEDMNIFIAENGLKPIYQQLAWETEKPIRVLMPAIHSLKKYFSLVQQLMQDPNLIYGSAWNGTIFYVYLSYIDPADLAILEADSEVIIEYKPE